MSSAEPAATAVKRATQKKKKDRVIVKQLPAVHFQ
jgi:hypothetical protein